MSTIKSIFCLRLFLLILIPLSTSACLPRPVLLQGELHGQLHWQGEVHLQGNVILAKDAVLTIAPGTRVLFLPMDLATDELADHPNFPGSELIIRGQIVAKGTAKMPISFQFVDPLASAGSWGGLNIEESPRAIFDYCYFTQADSAIHARQSWVVIENSFFSNNLVGIRFNDANMLIEKNLLQQNGAAIRFHFGSPVICKNEIRDNRKGLFITSEPRDYTIENNSFYNNRPYQVSLGEGVRDAVALGNNYWGSETAESLPATFFDGRLDDWLGTINFLPLRSQPDIDAGIRWKR